jgi:hypothetical protein
VVVVVVDILMEELLDIQPQVLMEGRTILRMGQPAQDLA